MKPWFFSCSLLQDMLLRRSQQQIIFVFTGSGSLTTFISNSWGTFHEAVKPGLILTQHTNTLPSLLWQPWDMQPQSKQATNRKSATTVLSNLWTRCFTCTKFWVDPMLVIVCHWFALSEILLWQTVYRKKNYTQAFVSCLKIDIYSNHDTQDCSSSPLVRR